MTRADFLRCLLASSAAGSVAAGANVLVITHSGLAAFSQALDGLRAGLQHAGVGVIAVDLPADGVEGEAQRQVARARFHDHARVAIALGDQAVRFLDARTWTVPIVASMVMEDELAALSRPLTASVSLDIPVADYLKAIRDVFPGKKRVAVITRKSLPAAPVPAEFTLRVVRCQKVEELLSAYGSLRGTVDLVICLPDSVLFNGTTVRPLVLGSVENNLPIVGFSASFVQAGAVLGVYPDYNDIGLQTAEVAAKVLAGESSPISQTPRKQIVAVNQRMLRLLGLKSEPQAAVVLIR